MSNLLDGLTMMLTDHYLVVAKLRDSLSVSKRATQNFIFKRSDRKKINDAKVKEQC
jgi:hypothetical protein